MRAVVGRLSRIAKLSSTEIRLKWYLYCCSTRLPNFCGKRRDMMYSCREQSRRRHRRERNAFSDTHSSPALQATFVFHSTKHVGASGN